MIRTIKMKKLYGWGVFRYIDINEVYFQLLFDIHMLVKYEIIAYAYNVLDRLCLV